MKRFLCAAAIGAALALGAPAQAQNLSVSAPQWAQSLLSADVTPTTGGRPLIAAPGYALSVRVTVAPSRGGVARVIRYDLRGETGTLALRRFTGHPTTGWWLWGADTPRVTPVTAAQRAEIATLARDAAIASATAGGQACADGERAYVEIAIEGRASAAASQCVSSADAVGRLSLRLSELAGSRTEEELAAAAVAELLEADRAFSARAQSDGVGAAFAAFAAESAQIVTATEVVTGRAGVAARYQRWPQGARLEWSPERGEVSARGDMGWTWGNSVYTAPDGTRTPGRYVSVWTRDVEGNWRYSFDAAIR